MDVKIYTSCIMKTAFQNVRDTAERLPMRLAKADMVFYTFPPLMMLLTIGTIAQKEMGLYAAHKMFFATFFVWLGYVPFPGAYTLIAILGINLTLKFLLDSPWSLKKSGIILSHLGTLVLIWGAILTAFTANEQFMAITEGQTSQYAYAYNKRELSIYGEETGRYVRPFETIKKGQDISLSAMPFKIRVLNKCENCDIAKREETKQTLPENISLKSMAQFMALEPIKPSREPEADISGLTVKITNAGDQDGAYLLFEGMPAPIEIDTDKGPYKIIMGKVQTRMPFSIRLDDFIKTDYAGTDKAKSYESNITIIDNIDGKDIEWPATIEMNKPLRYKGYTFFQSSFEQTPGPADITVLSVVENKGWLFPYLGTGLILIGLTLHLLVKSSTKRHKKEGS